MSEIVCFSLLLRTIVYFRVYIILDFPITYKNASVLNQSECTCLHQSVNEVVFFVKSNENTYSKGRALMQIYRVVPITKRELLKLLYNCFHHTYVILNVGNIKIYFLVTSYRKVQGKQRVT